MKRNSIILVLLALVLSISWVPMDACMPVKNKKKTTKVETKDTTKTVTVYGNKEAVDKIERTRIIHHNACDLLS